MREQELSTVLVENALIAHNVSLKGRRAIFFVERGLPEIVKYFDITPASVNYAVQRGEKMVKERG